MCLLFVGGKAQHRLLWLALKCKSRWSRALSNWMSVFLAGAQQTGSFFLFLWPSLSLLFNQGLLMANGTRPYYAILSKFFMSPNVLPLTQHLDNKMRSKSSHQCLTFGFLLCLLTTRLPHWIWPLFSFILSCALWCLPSNLPCLISPPFSFRCGWSPSSGRTSPNGCATCRPSTRPASAVAPCPPRATPPTTLLPWPSTQTFRQSTGSDEGWHCSASSTPSQHFVCSLFPPVNLH